MVVHLMDVRSYACLVDGCLLTDLELKEISSSDVIAVEDQLGCGGEESDDDEIEEGEDEREESEGEGAEEEGFSDFSEGEDDCSDEESENQDDGEAESEMFWNLEQMEILKSALPSFHFLPRTTVEKVALELKVEDQLHAFSSKNLTFSGIGRMS